MGYGPFVVTFNLVLQQYQLFYIFGSANGSPDFIFQLKFFKVTAFAFSVKLMIASLLNTFLDNIYQLVIGKVFYPTLGRLLLYAS
ncbi:oligosaccharide flippase family protein [Escherichia coli]|uniref:oligosaccharide flippase family protein n=1 Tax=Escherichia coli TaxID=562 RepID=UPI003313099A